MVPILNTIKVAAVKLGCESRQAAHLLRIFVAVHTSLCLLVCGDLCMYVCVPIISMFTHAQNHSMHDKPLSAAPSYFISSVWLSPSIHLYRPLFFE